MGVGKAAVVTLRGIMGLEHGTVATMFGMAMITIISTINFVHNHHFNNRFVAVGLGWWPGYYDYNYGGYGCGWLRRQALITGSPYWWNRYYACANYY